MWCLPTLNLPQTPWKAFRPPMTGEVEQGSRGWAVPLCQKAKAEPPHDLLMSPFSSPFTSAGKICPCRFCDLEDDLLQAPLFPQINMGNRSSCRFVPVAARPAGSISSVCAAGSPSCDPSAPWGGAADLTTFVGFSYFNNNLVSINR